MNRVKQFRLPLLWSVIYLVLLVSLVVPLLDMITVNFIMLAPLYLLLKKGWKTLAVSYILTQAVLYAIFGPLGLTLSVISLFFVPPAIAMGYFYRKQAPARKAIIAGVLTLLTEMMLVLVGAKLFGYNLIQFFEHSLRTSMELWKGVLSPDFIDQSVVYVIQMLPFFMLAFSVYYAFITHFLSRWVIRRSGVMIPGLPPLRQWKVPKSLVWYYLIVTVMDFTIKQDADPFLTMIVLNLEPVLTFVFAVQALSFLFYIVYIRKMRRTLPVVAIVLMFIWPSSLYLFSVLGLLDTVLPIRERFADRS